MNSPIFKIGDVVMVYKDMFAPMRTEDQLATVLKVYVNNYCHVLVGDTKRKIHFVHMYHV